MVQSYKPASWEAKRGWRGPKELGWATECRGQGLLGLGKGDLSHAYVVCAQEAAMR